jgi:porin
MKKYIKQSFTICSLYLTSSAWAYEITENLALDGILAAALQCQQLSLDTAGDETCKAAAPLQPTLTYRPTHSDRLFLKLGLAAGNGLNEVSPFNINTWGADLEDDVENINGSDRDYILEAWYAKVFDFDHRNRIIFTLGIIDASTYLDQNAYANDEYRQFMNPALSNAPNAFFPAYDAGLATQWSFENWVFSAVYMDVDQAASTDNYSFYGLQAAYRLETTLGTGNYRVTVNGDRGFFDKVDGIKQDNNVLIFSFDQQFGDKIAAFIRLGRRLDNQPIDYGAIYSGGIDLSGISWHRLLDNIGLGLVYLDGDDRSIIKTRIAETYYRMVINPYLACTFDIQYMHDEYVQAADVKGMIYSLRATLNF